MKLNINKKTFNQTKKLSYFWATGFISKKRRDNKHQVG
jgi:hypothetical protein